MKKPIWSPSAQICSVVTARPAGTFRIERSSQKAWIVPVSYHCAAGTNCRRQNLNDLLSADASVIITNWSRRCLARAFGSRRISLGKASQLQLGHCEGRHNLRGNAGPVRSRGIEDALPLYMNCRDETTTTQGIHFSRFERSQQSALVAIYFEHVTRHVHRTPS